MLAQETPDVRLPHKAVCPILLAEASIIQLAVNVGQEEVRRESLPPMLWRIRTCQKAEAEDDEDDDPHHSHHCH